MSSLSEVRGVTVFCGSSSGNDPSFLQAAKEVGTAIAKAGQRLVYGGGMTGLMGAVARSALDGGGSVHGVIPSAFISRPGSDTSHGGFKPVDPTNATADSKYLQSRVSSMHERKKLMADISHAFVVLPGGYGTLEECFETVTWTQLGIHKKPVVLLNVRGFYSPLRTFVESAIDAGFVAPQNRAFMTFVDATEDANFNWGEAALAAVDAWEKKGLGGGVPMSLEWGGGSNTNGDLR